MVDASYWQGIPESLTVLLSPQQMEIARLLATGMSKIKAAHQMGKDSSNMSKATNTIQRKLAQHGYTASFNATRFVDPGQQVVGKSTYTKDDEGNPVWIKTHKSKEAQQNAFLVAIQEAAQGLKPFKPVKAPKYVLADLCTKYTLTDFHLGMYSWADETGASWDMEIAETVMLNAFSDMMLGSPDSDTAIFAQLGDLLHWDGLLALTPTAKNVLDADTRFPLLVETSIRICVKAVEMLLHKHNHVHVIMAEGNHDQASSVWLRAIMSHSFRGNDRVTVDNSPFPFYAFVWGKTFLGWHHGHLQKMDNLPLLFATDPKFKSIYGQCLFTYIDTGHMHHQKVLDKGGIVVEQYPTLSARDAHGARGFLSSNRETKAVTYHKEHGEHSRITVRPNLKAA